MLQQFLKCRLPSLALFCVFLTFISPAHSSFEQFQTTRLKSTAGAGVGSILMDEATVLNPAPLAFFNISSLYYQRTGADTQSTAMGASSPFESPETKSNAFIVSDSKGGIAGSLSYVGQTQGLNEQKRYSIASSSVVGERSALGASYRITRTRLGEEGLDQGRITDKQWIFGVSHAVSPHFTLGLVAIDPFGSIEEERRAIVGGQYVFNDFIALMLDAGADYENDLSETMLIRGAAQFKIYNDFFLRFGAYQDEFLNETGNGIGVGWVQPRLVIDLAFNNSKREDEELSLSQRTKETSFSISYRF